LRLLQHLQCRIEAVAGSSGQPAFLTFPDVEPSDDGRWNAQSDGHQDNGPMPRGVTLRDQNASDAGRRKEADCGGGPLGSGPIRSFVNEQRFTALWTIGT
jgi:hypothetical protein